jgi:acyl carrier protein
VDDHSIQQQVRTFIHANFYVADASQLLGDTSLLDTGVIDSTGVIEIIHFLETTFGISIEDQEIVPDNLDSIQRITSFVARKRGSGELAVLDALPDPLAETA